MPAMRQPNCLIFGAGHLPFVFVSKRPTAGIKLSAADRGFAPMVTLAPGGRSDVVTGGRGVRVAGSTV